MENPLEVVLHPIRMRILMTLAGRELSAMQISEALGDVAQATLYRHLNRLFGAGVLAVTAERQVRGTVEKIYALNGQYGDMSPERLAELGTADHQRYFATFVASLLDDFSRYSKGADHLDLFADGVGYRKFPIELSEEEFAAMSAAVNAAMRPYLQNKPAPGRIRRIFATIVLPDRPAAATPRRRRAAVKNARDAKSRPHKE